MCNFTLMTPLTNYKQQFYWLPKKCDKEMEQVDLRKLGKCHLK